VDLCDKMKNRLHKVELYLREEVRARERANRYKAIRNMIIHEFPSLVNNHITNDKLDEIIFNAIQINRCIQRAQQLDKTLRGSDYADKKVELEQNTQIDLEYTPGYRQDLNKLKTL